MKESLEYRDAMDQSRIVPQLAFQPPHKNNRRESARESLWH